MPTCPLRGTLPLTLLAGVFLASASAGEANQSWRSPLLGRELVIIEKSVPGADELAAPELLPEPIRAGLGVDAVEYESFVATVLPEAEAEALTATALAENRGVLEDPRAPITLAFHTFDPAKPGERTAPWDGSPYRPEPVPDLILLRFAFPLLDEWTEGSTGLPGCGVHPLVYYGDGTFLAAAKNLNDVINCPVARYLSWAGSFLTTDRISPETLEKADAVEMKPYSLTFVPGTTLQVALGELPLAMVPGESMVWDDGSLTLAAQATRPELEALVATGPHLLSVFEAAGEPEPADERQGLIVAGKYEGYSTGAVTGAVTGPGTYLSWLGSRNLLLSLGETPTTVAVFDTGFDDGSGVNGSHHPDLAGKLAAERSFVFNQDTEALEDTRGHGTMVAGIIAGKGTAAATKDRQGYFLGTGIAPESKLVAVQVMDTGTYPVCRPKAGFGTPPDNIGAAIAFARSNGAVIGNHSWNLVPVTYDAMAQLFDKRSIDAIPEPTGGPLEPMLMIVAAGNAGRDEAVTTIQSPATAKNVITVGATQSYRPSGQDQAPPNACTYSALNTSLFTREANNIGEVSAFSSRGTPFTPLGQPGVRLHTVRIKPDLVAPGGRVVSTVPFTSPYYQCSNLCRPSWPAGQYYSISSGTSFAAPVVSGAAALAIKWFRNQGLTNPSPSLIKAALIATARDLGLAPGQDHRPSRDFGWGRVDLARLTDSLVKRFYVSDDATTGVATGQERMWQRTIDQPGKDTLIVLAWSDPASTAVNGPGPLVNDLRLKVELVGSTASWWGNNFRENIVGDDNGYSYRYNTVNAGKSDITNTVEAVLIPANTFTAGQRLTIKIQGKSVLAGPQKFAVYAYNFR